MINMDEIIRRLEYHEGLKLMPYKCPTGFLSIGIGRNLITNPLTSEEGKAAGDWAHGITKQTAYYLARNDVRRVIKECRDNIPFWRSLDPERKYALFDMCFNMGIRKLLRFKKMLSCMEIGDYRGAAKECLASKYARETGRRAERIARLIEKGEFVYD